MWGTLCRGALGTCRFDYSTLYNTE